MVRLVSVILLAAFLLALGQRAHAQSRSFPVCPPQELQKIVAACVDERGELGAHVDIEYPSGKQRAAAALYPGMNGKLDVPCRVRVSKETGMAVSLQWYSVDKLCREIYTAERSRKLGGLDRYNWQTVTLSVPLSVPRIPSLPRSSASEIKGCLVMMVKEEPELEGKYRTRPLSLALKPRDVKVKPHKKAKRKKLTPQRRTVKAGRVASKGDKVWVTGAGEFEITSASPWLKGHTAKDLDVKLKGPNISVVGKKFRRDADKAIGPLQLNISSKSRWIRLRPPLVVNVQIPGPPSKVPLIILGAIVALLVGAFGTKLYKLMKKKHEEKAAAQQAAEQAEEQAEKPGE